MLLTTHQLSTLNATIAHLDKVYDDKPEVPTGALLHFANSSGLKLDVAVENGDRILVVNRGAMKIKCGPAPGPVQPLNSPTGLGEIMLFNQAKVA